MIVRGMASTGKTYLIRCLQLLMNSEVNVGAPTGIAAFIIDGTTLHTLLALPTKGEFKYLEGNRLHQLQELMAGVKYQITDRCPWSEGKHSVR